MARTSLVVAVLAIAGYLYYQQCRVPVAPSPKGSCTQRFKGIEKAFKENYANRVESGSAFAVYHQGELVCDLWGGWADHTTALPWSEETMPIVFSTTKGVSAITIALLCDRGFCDYDTLVTEYWPEFGQNGKDNVTLGMLLSHQAGLASIDETLSMKMLRDDPDKVGRIFAAQKPNWPPGTMSGYHALSFAVVVDQVVRRIDPKHRSLDQVFHEEIAEPYDIDFFIGAPLAQQWRVARYVEQPLLSVLWDCFNDFQTMKLMMKLMWAPDKMTFKAFTNPQFEEGMLNWPEIRSIPQGSFNGYGTARGLARLFSLVAAAESHDDLADVAPLLSAEAVQKMSTALTSGTDRILGFPVSKGPGVFVTPDADGKGNAGFYHAGKGTQLTMGIDNLDLAFSYITNFAGAYANPLVDPRLKPLYEALLESMNV